MIPLSSGVWEMHCNQSKHFLLFLSLHQLAILTAIIINAWSKVMHMKPFQHCTCKEANANASSLDAYIIIVWKYGVKSLKFKFLFVVAKGFSLYTQAVYVLLAARNRTKQHHSYNYTTNSANCYPVVFSFPEVVVSLWADPQIPHGHHLCQRKTNVYLLNLTWRQSSNVIFMFK